MSNKTKVSGPKGALKTDPRLLELTDGFARRLQQLVNDRPSDISRDVWLATCQAFLIKSFMPQQDTNEPPTIIFPAGGEN